MKVAKGFSLLFLLLLFSCANPTVIRGGKEVPYERAALSDYQTIQQLIANGRDDQALLTIQRFEQEFPESKYLGQVQYSRGEIFYRRGNYNEAAASFEKAALNSGEAPLRSHAYYNQAVSLFYLSKHQASSDALDRVDLSAVGPEIQRKVSDLRSQLDKFVVRTPTPIEDGENIPVARTSIGVILPLSGDYASFGRNSLQGIQLAAKIWSQSYGAPVPELSIIDDRGDPEEARRAVGTLLERDHVIGIVGPLLGGASETAAQRAQELEVAIIPLSQKEGITKGRSFVFRNSMINSLQARELVRYAMDVRGMNRFAILYPTDDYGQQFATFFEDEVRRKGGVIVKKVAYASGQTDFRHEIRELADIENIEARKEEWLQIKTEMEAKLGREVKSSEVELPPHVEYEGLFIPDYTKTVGQIVPAWFAYGGGAEVTFLGTSGWNSPDLLRRAGEHVGGAIFVDGWFPGGANPYVQNFYQTYQQEFGKEPDILAAQSYDATAILLELLKNPSIQTRAELKNGLKRMKNFPGVTGNTSFTSDGEVEKALIVLTPDRGAIRRVQ